MEKEYLYLMLAVAAIVISALTAAVISYRRRLMKCKATLIRYINENIEIRQKLPASELPRFIGRNDLTPEEFTRIIHNMLKRLMFVASLALAFVMPATAQTVAADSIKYAADGNRFAMRANLLRWATLTPDLGIEWRPTSDWGVLVNASYTSWQWDSKNRRYALWEVTPEVRRYLGEKRRWYVGAMLKGGHFNHKFSAIGKQGDLFGGGITGGYRVNLNKALSLDFDLALGYVNAFHVERYRVIDGVRVRQGGKESKHWVGPVNAGVTLVWKLP